jgi:hypothetical protein
VLHPQQQPKITVVISPTGTITSGEIVSYSEEYMLLRKQASEGGKMMMMSEGERASLQGGLWFPRLPRTMNGGIGRDTLVTSRTLTVANAGTVERPDSTITTYRDMGHWSYAGIDCIKIVVNSRRIVPISETKQMVVTSLGEVYLRASDGLPVHIEQTTVSSHPDGGGTSYRSEQDAG